MMMLRGALLEQEACDKVRDRLQTLCTQYSEKTLVALQKLAFVDSNAAMAQIAIKRDVFVEIENEREAQGWCGSFEKSG